MRLRVNIRLSKPKMSTKITIRSKIEKKGDQQKRKKMEKAISNVEKELDQLDVLFDEEKRYLSNKRKIIKRLSVAFMDLKEERV